MSSARTHCPDCLSDDILDLRKVLKSPSYDYYRCGACNCWWMVPSDADRPVTRVILGNRKTANVQHQPQSYGVCVKCGSQTDLLEMSLFARVDYYRCARCGDVSARDPAAESAPVDVSVRADDKAS